MMTPRINRPGRTPSSAWVNVIAVAVLVLVAGQPARSQWATNGNNIHNTNSGNVGVGTTTPGSKLTVLKDASSLGAAETESGLRVDDGLNSVSMMFGVHRAANVGYLQTIQPGVSWSSRALALQPMGGNVGIGINGTPAQRLTLGVTGGGQLFLQRFVNYGAVFRFDDTANAEGAELGYNVNGAYTARIRWNERNTHLTLQPSGGNVGIGTANPESRLHVGTHSDAINHADQLTVYSSVADHFNVARFSSNQPRPLTLSIGVNQTNGYTELQSWMSGVTFESKLVLQRQGGNVGIGTIGPAAKLHVAGDIRVDGNITAKYQDVAEWVPARQKLAAGTVVVVDPAGVNHVLASTSAYDTSVAGVVSAQPGLILGEGGESKVMVATTGRVRVRVDATHAPIRAGDLLVTSSVAGVAMRSEPVTFGGALMHRPGTIIGKALEPLERGRGEILVLLSLQ